MSSRLSRHTFLAAAGALALGARGLPAAAAERRVNNVLIESDRWLLPAWESFTDPDDAGVAKTLDLVAETSKLLEAKGIGLLSVAIPFKARYCDALAPGTIAPAVSTRYARALQAMQSRGLKTVDLDAVMRPVQSPSQTVFYHTDQHWTTPSAEAAGAAIAAAVRANFNLPDKGQRDPAGPIVTDKRMGDLATLLSPADQSALGPETFMLRTAYDADLKTYDLLTGSYAAPDDTVVQVVGSSFVRPMWGLPQKLGSDLGRHVGVTFFNGDLGPYHTLLVNLRSTIPKRTPSVIVWQTSEANLHLGPAASGWFTMSSLMSPDYFLTKVKEALAR